MYVIMFTRKFNNIDSKSKKQKNDYHQQQQQQQKSDDFIWFLKISVKSNILRQEASEGNKVEIYFKASAF